MSPPSSSNENQKEENGNSTSWFGSWFEGSDVRNDIHEQLNDFDERKKRYEEDLQERQRFLYRSPFQSFFPPANDNNINNNNSSNNSNNAWEECFGSGHDHPRRHSDSRTHEYFEDNNTNSSSSSTNDCDRNRNTNTNGNIDIDEIHREMQNMFETAFAGSGILSPKRENDNDNLNSKRGGWNNSSSRMPFTTSSSSTSVVSNSNGSSYRMQQDSRMGARIDVQLPRKNSSSNNSTIDDITLEVLKEHPCVIQWGRNNDGNNNNSGENDWRQRRRRQPNKQMVELGDSIDCSKLSASISEARNTLTVEAPIRRRHSNHRSRNGEEEESLSLSLTQRQQQQQQSPRSVTVSKTD